MGRAARTKHERREVARWAQAAELADHVIAHCLAQAFGRTGALDLDALRSLRAQAAQRTAWPSWSWLPNTIFVEDLLATNGIDIDQTDDAELEKYCRLAAAMTRSSTGCPAAPSSITTPRCSNHWPTRRSNSPSRPKRSTGCPRGGSTWTCRGSPAGPASSRA
jgi:hypothetical protein